MQVIMVLFIYYVMSCAMTSSHHGILQHKAKFPASSVFLYKGMEEVKRQFGQHIALEPEWEASYYFQIELRHILATFQDWCSSNVSLVLPLLMAHPKT